MRGGDLAADSEVGTSARPKTRVWVQRRQPHPVRPAAPEARAANPDEVPEEALHGIWQRPAPHRRTNLFFVAVAIVGALVGMVLLLSFQTFDALAVLVGFTVTGLLAYTALSVSSPTTVSLDGPFITVSRGRQTDEFDLSGPIRRVSTVGRPNRPNWRVRLETIGGKIVELDPTQVDSVLLHAAITRYRTGRIPQQRTER
jgi:hypothetical protein